MNATLAGRAAELRAAFDQSFAEPARFEVTATENLLAFRVGTDPYALRLSDIAGLYADRPIARVPSTAKALIGLAGIRGTIAPVYDLHALLGWPPIERPKWLAVAAAAPVGLALEVFEGHLRAPREAILPRDAGQTQQALSRAFALMDGTTRAIVHLPAVLELIGARTPSTS